MIAWGRAHEFEIVLNSPSIAGSANPKDRSGEGQIWALRVFRGRYGSPKSVEVHFRMKCTLITKMTSTKLDGDR